MIRNLSGTITELEENHLVLDVNGVGYLVFVPQLILASLSLESEVSLSTHLAVRETSMELYGFSSKDELAFFEMLLGVSGVGPKSALSIVNLAPVPELISAIAAGDSVYLTKVSGVGRRSAAKIIVELKEKLEHHKEREDSKTQDASDTLAALLALGYTIKEAREALRETNDVALNTSERIREALRYLSHS
ncbi:MAG: Holliday junction branch migration protein RuvA [Candidatus Paceibacterota bacterium]